MTGTDSRKEEMLGLSRRGINPLTMTDEELKIFDENGKDFKYNFR